MKINTIIKLPLELQTKLKKYGENEPLNILIARAIHRQANHISHLTSDNCRAVLQNYKGEPVKSASILLDKEVNAQLKIKAIQCNISTHGLYVVLLNDYVATAEQELCENWGE